MKISMLMVALLLAPVMAHAEVVASSDTGFLLHQQVTVSVKPSVAYRQFLRVGQWWDSNHTWFGKAQGLYIQPRVGGCFCERQGQRQALHMTVTYVDPGHALKMVGGLGPLQMMGVNGGMAWTFTPTTDGTRIALDYQASGFTPGGLQKLAAVVDKVQGQQLARLAARLKQD